MTQTLKQVLGKLRKSFANFRLEISERIWRKILRDFVKIVSKILKKIRKFSESSKMFEEFLVKLE